MTVPHTRNALYFPPGVYTVASDDPNYARMLALCALGKAREVSTRFLPDGRKAIACEVGPQRPKRNDGSAGQMTLDPEYFQGALKDYENWPIKWWREAIQNAVDAKAARIALSVDDVGDEVLVACDDDGVGMDRTTLLEKFLRLGASGKRGDAEAKGGFGKAKEMLLLPWRRWTVETRDTRVTGVGIAYTVETIPYRKGTRLSVAMPPDQATTLDLAAEFVDRCYLPRVTFHLSGSDRASARDWAYEKRADTKPGKLIREIEGKARIYHDKKSARGCYVRTGGLWMFDRYIPSGVQGLIVVELTGKSIDLLTANRDSIRDWKLSVGVDSFLSELSADTTSALREKQKIRKVYSGAGKFRAKPSSAIQADLLAASTGAIESARRVAPGELLLDVNIVQQLAQALAMDAGASEAQVGHGTVNVGASPAAVAATVLASTTIRGQSDVEKVIRQLAWQPDFLVVNNRTDWKPPAGMLPERMSKRALHLAKVWTELCRYVLIALGSGTEFGVGWVFDQTVGAQYEHDASTHWLLFQPYRDAEKGELFDPRDAEHVRWITACAIHEVTHMNQGISLHNEAFAGALTQNMARCAGVWTVAPLLVDALAQADVDLVRAIEVAQPQAPGAGRGSRPRVVEKIVERPVERVVYREPPPPPPWYAQPILATGAPRDLTLAPAAARSAPRGQGMLALKFNGRRRR